MGRARDIANLINSNTFLTPASASVTYQGAPNRNLIINGAMQVAQRATSIASITTSGYRTADRWGLSFAGAQNFGTWTQSVENDGPSGSEFAKSLKMLCTTAQASPASSAALILFQAIEGQNLQGIKKGTSAAQTLTVSFWVKSNIVGTYICSLLDENNSIGFPPYGTAIARTYTVNTIDTWERKTLTFSAGTSGVIPNSTGAGLRLYHWLGAGSSYQSGTLNSTWASNAPGTEAVGQVNLASAINNYWQITGIQLEIGSTATPFELKSYAQNLEECQRYYQTLSYVFGTCISTTTIVGRCMFPVAMRSAPSTVTSTGVLNWQEDGLGSNTTQSSIGTTNNNSQPESLNAVFTNFTGLTAGRHGTLAYPGNNSNRIIANAEI